MSQNGLQAFFCFSFKCDYLSYPVVDNNVEQICVMDVASVLAFQFLINVSQAYESAME